VTAGPTLGVIGLGLIGGSIAQGWRAEEAGDVVAWTRSPDTRAEAAERGIHMVGSVAEVVGGADVVVLATPLPVLPETLAQVADVVGSGPEPPTITDVGSVKGPLHDLARRLLPDPAVFVPGHPLAGLEHAGWGSADPSLFRTRVWALAADHPVSMERWLLVAGVALRLGSVVVPVAADEHDRAVALTSHLPHLVAAGLRTMIEAEPSALTATLVGGSFASATRVVQGSGRLLGAEMAWANRDATVQRIEQLTDELGRQRAMLTADTPESIVGLFSGWEVASGGSPATVSATREELLGLGRRGGVVTGVDAGGGTVDGLDPGARGTEP